MLTSIRKSRHQKATGTFAIVASKYNGRYVDSMLRAAQAELTRAGAKEIKVVRVPGAFEIPAVASRLAQQEGSRFSAIITLGVIFQGETSHAQHIGWGVTHALAQIQVQTAMPVVHGVFVFEDKEHARVRCLDPKHNRGHEAAQTALKIARVMKSLTDSADRF